MNFVHNLLCGVRFYSPESAKVAKIVLIVYVLTIILLCVYLSFGYHHSAATGSATGAAGAGCSALGGLS